MPIYEYACKQCGHAFDALQKMSDDPLTDCPECGAPELRKLVSAPNFRLKGGGWYETDFKTDNKRNLVDGSSGTKGKKDAKGDKTGGDKAAGGKDSKSAKADKASTGGKSADTGS